MKTYTEEEYNEVLRTTAEQLQQSAAALAAMTASRDALAAIIANAKALHLSGDHAALEALFTEAEKTDAQKALEAAQEKLAAAQAELAAAAARAAQQ
jgi:hypothetical protein